MKKIISLLLAAVLLVLPLSACGPKEKTAVRLGGMTGPTSIGMVDLLKKDADAAARNDYDFFLAQSGEEIKTKLLTGELDIAAIPANLASALYNASEGKIKLIAINTLGVVSLLEKGNTVNSFADLKGKKIYAPATAKGAIPELVFNYFLSLNNIDPKNDLTIEWVEATALAGKLKTEAGALVLTPQPNATAILTKVEGARTALDLNEEWKKLDNGCEYVTGVVVARTEFIEQNPKAVKDFLTDYKASVEAVNTSAAADTAALVKQFNILALEEAVIANAIPACNITYINGEEMKTVMSGFIDLLFDASPKAFGGKKPDDAFYYVAK